jgi:signal peptidase I
MLRFFRVTGESMTPDLQQGDFVLVAKIPLICSSIKAGDVIVFRQSEYGTLIKKVSHISSRGEAFFVSGSNPLSTDSRQFGPVHCKDVFGKVIWHIHPPHQSSQTNK